MKWKYRLEEEETEQKDLPPQIFITQGGGSQGSSSVRVVENTIFFYSDVTEQSALELNQALYELDSKLKNTFNFLANLSSRIYKYKF